MVSFSVSNEIVFCKEWVITHSFLLFEGEGLKMSRIVDKVSEIIEPIIEDLGYELVETEFIKEGSDWFLRVYIDSENGVKIDDCADISKAISGKLDENDVIIQAYNLEVSSPGIERVLKKDKDFQRFKGSKVSVKLFTNFQDKKQFTGNLGEVDEESLKIISEEEISIPRDLISRVNLLWED